MFFSDIEQAAEAAEYLSVSESLASNWHSNDTSDQRFRRQSLGQQSRGATNGGTYALSIATRGLLYANTNPVHPRWAPLMAPKGKEVRNAADNCLKLARAAFAAEAKVCHTRQLMSLDLPYHPKASLLKGRGARETGLCSMNMRHTMGSCSSSRDDLSWEQQRALELVNKYPALQYGAPRTSSRFSRGASKSLDATDLVQLEEGDHQFIDKYDMPMSQQVLITYADVC